MHKKGKMPDHRTTIRQFLEQIRDERMTSANTATRIGRAFIMLLDYMSDAPYIRKDQNDSTSYILQMLAGAIIGDSATLLKANGEIVTQLLQAMIGIETPIGIVDDVESSDFSSDTSGFRIAEDGSGKYVLEIDEAKIRDNIEAAVAQFAQADIGEVISPIVFNRLVTMLQGLVCNVLESSDYDQGVQGYKLYKQQNGRYILEISDIEVFGKMVVHELEVRKESYSGGNRTYSHAGSHIVRVEEVYAGLSVSRVGNVLHLDGAVDVTGNVLHISGGTLIGNVLHLSDSEQLYAYRCFLKADDGSIATTNWWRVNDQARCQTYNLDGRGKYNNVQNSYYWRRVLKIGMEELEDGLMYDYLDLSAGDAVSGSTVPMAGDDIVQVGNRTDTERQGILSFEVYGRYAPAFKVYRGINSYTLEGKMKICISPRYTELRLQKFIIETEYDTQPVVMERGPWDKIKDHRCYYYNVVQHHGASWLCTFPESGINGIYYTTEEPSEYATYWEVYASAGKDGSDGKSFNILGSYATETELTTAHPTGEISQAYLVNGFLYVWDEVNSRWQNAGRFQGETGNGVSSVTISYGVSDSPTAYPTEWESNPASLVLVQGKWLFTRMVFNYTNGSTSQPSYSMAYFGQDGRYKSIVFARTNKDISNASLTGGTYDSPIPNSIVVDGETITFSDGDPGGEAVLWATSDIFRPDNTHVGWTPPRRQTDTSTFDVEFSPSVTKPANPSDTESARTAQGWYDPDRNPTFDFSTTIWRAERRKKNGVWGSWAIEKVKGEKGEKGEKGDNITIDSNNSSTMYCVANQGTTPPAANAGWQVARPNASKGQYVWSRVITAYSDGNSTTVYGCEYIPTDGQNGANGADGTSVTIVGTPLTTYCLTQSGTQPADSQFTLTSIPALTLGYYLWSKTEVNYSDGNQAKTYGVNRLGADGSNGTPGTDGYTTHFAYATSADGSENFSTTNFNGATYIGTYRDKNAADSTNYRDYTWTQWKGNKGDTGADGADGKDSATGYTAKSAIAIETNIEGRVLADFSEEVELGMYVGADDLTVTRVTVSEGAPRYVLTDRHILVIHRSSTAYRSGTVLHTSDITERVGSVLHVGGEHSSFVTVPRVVARKSQLLDEHIVKLSLSAIDINGTEYQARAYFQILRNYIAEDGKDGHTGTNGENAIMLYLSPANVIITQSDQEDGNGNYPIDLTNAFTDIRLMAGENDITSRATVKSVTPSSVTISGQNRATCAVTRSGQRVTITALGTRADAAQGETPQYFEVGYVTIIMTYNDLDYEARFNFLCNLLGSFKQRIVGDMQQIFATKTQYQQLANNALMKSEWDAKYEQSSQGTVAQLAKIVAITGVNGENIFTQQQQALYAQTVSENISELKSKVDNGKNLIPSANDWVGNNGSASTVSYGGRFAITDTSNDLYSPVVKLKKNTKYCFSAYFDNNPANDSAYALSTTKYANGYQLYAHGTTYTPVWHADDNRYYFTFQTGNSDVYFAFNFFRSSANVLYRPQLEIGETPTEFEASSYEVSSLIKQVADAIEMKVSDKVSTSVFNQTAQSLQTQVNGKASSSELTQTASTLRSEISSGLSGKVDTSTFNQTVNGINAKVNSRSKNLLDCANGEGWREWSDNTMSDYDSTKQKIISSDSYSTAVYLKAGVTYVLSFYCHVEPSVLPFWCGGDPDVDSGVDSDDQLSELTLTRLSETYENVARYYATFTPQNTGYYKFDIYGNSMVGFYRPQIEVGDSTPTAWEPGGRNSEGQIQVAAENVRLGVKNALSQAGIDIDAHTVRLYGNKVTFSNASGTVTDMISIDPETGTLIAEDGVFRGSLLFHRMISQSGQYHIAKIYSAPYVTVDGQTYEGTPVKLVADIVIVSGSINSVGSNTTVYFPPASLFPGAKVKIINGTYSTSQGHFELELSTITLHVNHPYGAEQRAEDNGLVAQNHFAVAMPFTDYLDHEIFGYFEELTYNIYKSVELVSTKNMFNGNAYYVWMVIDADAEES